MIRSIRLLAFACVFTMAFGALAQEHIGIRSDGGFGLLRGLNNAHVLVVEITEDGGKCELTKDSAEKEFLSGIRAFPVTPLNKNDKVDNLFIIGVNTIYEKGFGVCTSNMSVDYFHNTVFYHAGLDELIPDIVQIWAYDIIFDSLRKDHAKVMKKVIAKAADAFDKAWKNDNAPETASRRERSRGIVPPHPRAATIGKGFRRPSGGITGKDLR